MVQVLEVSFLYQCRHCDSACFVGASELEHIPYMRREVHAHGRAKILALRNMHSCFGKRSLPDLYTLHSYVLRQIP
jgi:hypothetical protein